MWGAGRNACADAALTLLCDGAFAGMPVHHKRPPVRRRYTCMPFCHELQHTGIGNVLQCRCTYRQHNTCKCLEFAERLLEGLHVAR